MSDLAWPYADSAREVHFQLLTTDPETVEQLGTEMMEIGQMMSLAAVTLENVANSSDGQQGKAIDSLRESVGDSHELLRKAGAMYTPIGEAVFNYGRQMCDIQEQANQRYETALSEWTKYSLLPGEKEGRGSGFFQLGEPEADSKEAAEDAAKASAYDDWAAAAKLYADSHQEWDDAWGTAVKAIGEELTDDLKDGFWQDLEALGDALGWVALVIGVAALIIGGPILAALALIAGIAALVIVFGQYTEGSKSLGDVAIAALGVLPFGKLAGVTKLMHFNKAAFAGFGKSGITGITGLKGILSKPKLGDDSLIKVFQTKGANAGFQKLVTGNSSFKDVYRTHKQFWQGPGQRMADIRNGNAVRYLATGDYVLSAAGTLAGHYSRAATVFGWGKPPTSVDVLL